MPSLTGPVHIDLTVTDLDRSVAWWEKVMGFSRIVSREQETFRVCTMADASGFGVSLMSHDATGSDRFDETRVGLDHLAFGVADRGELDAWVAHLDSVGAQHTGVIEAHYGDTVVIRDPDNVQLELFVFNPRGEDLGMLFETDPHRAT
jgi:catechol 2,3-dioxygenase-like lactoylglutathione lyase family enzyme